MDAPSLSEAKMSPKIDALVVVRLMPSWDGHYSFSSSDWGRCKRPLFRVGSLVLLLDSLATSFTVPERIISAFLLKAVIDLLGSSSCQFGLQRWALFRVRASRINRKVPGFPSYSRMITGRVGLEVECTELDKLQKIECSHRSARRWSANQLKKYVWPATTQSWWDNIRCSLNVRFSDMEIGIFVVIEFITSSSNRTLTIVI